MQPGVSRRVYQVRDIPADVFATERAISNVLFQVAEKLEKLDNDKQQIAASELKDPIWHSSEWQIGDIYNELVNTIHNIMDDSIPHKDITQRTHKSGRRGRHRPYWNNHLKELWKIAIAAERKYLHYKGRQSVKNELRNVFTRRRFFFDRALRRSEREYRAKQRDKLCSLRNQDPRQFWERVKQMAPGGKKWIQSVKMMVHYLPTLVIYVKPSNTHSVTFTVPLTTTGRVSQVIKISLIKWKTTLLPIMIAH